jgi:hypothetical protein
MARQRKPASPNLDMPGQPPLLQGHLQAGGMRSIDRSEVNVSKPATDGAADVGPGGGDATRGRATKSDAAVATREHLEGSEQGPS